ncbi:MAG: four helix bundle protein [Planctomycetes bacterium]|nr:four helix bundle protein [Planctomycetota bacterium]
MHERLIAYQAATELLRSLRPIVDRLPAGNADARDQIKRAGLSILLNLAEGSADGSAAERARFFRIALRSAAEIAASLDALELLGIAVSKPMDTARTNLHRVVALIAALHRSIAPKRQG